MKIRVCGGPAEYIRLTTPRAKAVPCTQPGCKKRTRDPHDSPKCRWHWVAAGYESR